MLTLKITKLLILMRFFVNVTLKPGMKVANFIRHMSTKPHLLSQITMGHLTPTTTYLKLIIFHYFLLMLFTCCSELKSVYYKSFKCFYFFHYFRIPLFSQNIE